MITKVEVKNFRNLKDFAFLVNEKATIIAGQNGLGKSNLLNAICWFFTNTLLTDKWGTGENDIDTIIVIINAIRVIPLLASFLGASFLGSSFLGSSFFG